MLLTLCRLLFILLGPATFSAAPLTVQAVAAPTGLVRSVIQRALAAWASVLAMSVPRTTTADITVSASAVFCESRSLFYF